MPVYTAALCIALAASLSTLARQGIRINFDQGVLGPSTAICRDV